MGKGKKKTGKGRLDKYYKLAKEQGYRARSAFKLIQLNKKYAFLESARCVIDLCAAPGGWLQVASKYMPANSIIVGVDLDPIKPIPRVVTFTSDITTPQCRNLIRGELKDWKADVVLHDGAPNVGTAWIQDAYSQSELVLMSLKLAVEFLAKGGTFVTKVFRSVDYNNLIWVFNQLFGKVEATKPPSSRNVSAEIFVVCRDYLAPKHIDPKFLDPRHVFKDLASTISLGGPGMSAGNAESNVFHPEKKRRHRDGYADGDYTLFKSLPVSTFVLGPDPITVLGSTNKFTFSSQEEQEQSVNRWLTLNITTGDVKANCEDLKVLGKGDFKTLIKWRLALREELGLDLKAKNTDDATEDVEVVEVVDEEQDIADELERLNAEVAARVKRERRKANEIKTRAIQRMQLQMTAPLDIGMEQQDATLGLGQDDMFDLDQTSGNTPNNANKPAFILDDDGDAVVESSDEESQDEGEEVEVLNSEEEKAKKVTGLEAELDGLYDAYRGRLRERDAKFKVKEARRKNSEREAWTGIQDSKSGGTESEEEGGWEKLQDAKVNDDSSSDDGSNESDADIPPKSRKRTRVNREFVAQHNKRPRLLSNINPAKPQLSTSATAKVWFAQEIFSEVDGLEDVSDYDGSDISMHDSHDDARSEHVKVFLLNIVIPFLTMFQPSSEASCEDFEVVPQDQEDNVDLWDAYNDDENETVKARIQKISLLTPEAVTLAQQLVNRQTNKTQLINDGFNRYSLNSKDGLPSWFLDDEAKNYKLNIPVTKEAMAALRAKQRALDARPIKKVAEAKARKKFKTAQRLEKAMKKAEGVNATADMSEKEKAQQIDKLMRKGMSSGQKVKKEIKLVVAKGAHKGVKGRPKGVKGRYTMVDSRMKKEVRAKKRKEKTSRKRR
ncbi:FtsJ-domain-containing protein [Pholiota conissans]|uniref:FtsJ-domain-containing protein n=1 Tax=Pholiota conissans TaxID=109636 RepID=A0A9P5YQS6_9AGAR|nr:FtsJ-domain-containing protein [Pholiota conissans]